MRSTARVRVLLSLAMAAVVMVLPTFPAAIPVAIALVVNAMVVFPLRAIAPDRLVSLVSMVQNQTVAVAIAALVPELWSAALLVIVADSIWSFLRTGSHVHKWVAFVGPIAIAAVGVASRPDGWLPAAIVGLFISVVFALLSTGMQAMVQDREDDLAQALSTSGALVHVSHLSSGKVRRVDGPVEEVTGWTRNEWVTRDHLELIHPEDVADFWVDLDKASVGDLIDRKGRFLRADGTYTWIRDVSRIVRDAKGDLLFRGISMDVTEMERAQAVIRHQAETDALTGLANRPVLTNELDLRITAGRSFGLILLDLDRFKRINDTLGHSFGDDVLIEIADRLRTLTAQGNVVSRLGGDEFALIVEGLADDETATAMAQHIAEECSRAMSIQGITLASGVSIGISLAPRDGDNGKTLLRHADIAMYAAKRRHNRFQIFDTDIQQAPLEEVTLSAGIGPGLDNGEFLLHFQPKVNTITGQVTGFEGLARWEHPLFGLLSPKRFVHLIMLSNFAAAFSDRVLELGGQFAAKAAAAGWPVPISVNISARTLYDSTFPDRVADVLQRHGLQSDQLIIEITEHDIMNRTSDESGVLARLGELGVALSIDDFGTGYSSLARLIDLPVSEIKIDRRFISRLLDDDRDAVVVRSIIDLARNLDLHVVAEGIEHPAEATMLHAFGCHHAQGFLYSDGVAEEQALALLSDPPTVDVLQDAVLARPKVGPQPTLGLAKGR